MKRGTPQSISNYRLSRGAILLLSLILLLAMSIIAVAAMETSILQSQMSRNNVESNTRHQVTTNEMEAYIKHTANSADYLASIITGEPISNQSVGVSRPGKGLILTDSDRRVSDNSDDHAYYSQSGYVVFSGFETGATHGFSLGKTKTIPIEFNIITTLKDTNVTTNHTQGILLTAPLNDG